MAAHPRPYGPAIVAGNGQVVPPTLLREDAGFTKGKRVTFYWWPGESRILMVIGDDPDADGYPPLPQAGR